MLPLWLLASAAGAGGFFAGRWWLKHEREKSDSLLVEAVNAIKEGRASRAQLEKAAREAQRTGQPETAAALRKAAVLVAGIEIAGAPAVDEPPAPSNSPLPDIAGGDWHAFASAFVVGELTSRDGDRRGMFGQRWARIKELRPELLEADFLASAELQYELFCEDMKRNRASVLSRHPDAVGMNVDGAPATLSGLMAVARCAGLAGLKSWIENPDERARFPVTLDYFARTNGIF